MNKTHLADILILITARYDEDAVMARDLLEKITEIEEMVKTLGI